MKINDMLRAQYVKRFHIVHTLKHQSVAEHSFNVAMIAREIAIEFGLFGAAVEEVMLIALCHDLDEVITGDIPTPTKERAKAGGVNLNDNGIEVPYKAVLEDHKLIVKVADYMEAIWFLDDNGIGDHAQEVQLNIIGKMDQFIDANFTVEQVLGINAVEHRMVETDFAI